MGERKVEFSTDEAYELLKIKVIEEVLGEVLNKLKKKLWIFGIVFAIVGFFGINGIVTMTIYGLLKDDLRSAQKASFTAEETTKGAKMAVKSVAKLVSDLENQEKEINNRLERVLNKAEAKAENVRAFGEQETTILDNRLKQLESLVKDIALKQPALVTQYQSQVDQLKSYADQKREIFELNSKFSFEVLLDKSNKEALTLGDKINNQLTKEGFQAEGPHDLAEGIIEFGEIPENHIIVTKASRERGYYVQQILISILSGKVLPIIDVSEIKWYKKQPMDSVDEFFLISLSKEGI